MGWGYSSVANAIDHHSADAGLIPQCGKGFFSQSQLLVQTLLRGDSMYMDTETAAVKIEKIEINSV